MKITKYGHCCLLIEVNGVRIVTDPGSYSSGFTDLQQIDVILVTHEHQDHFHLDSVKELLKNNPRAKIITNSGVGALLTKEGIAFALVGDGQSTVVNNVVIEGHGKDHAILYQNIPDAENTGYFINNELFYPGDSFYNPNKPVRVLALPVAGPWMKVSEAIDYCLAVKPKIAFPVHDGASKSSTPSAMYSQFIPAAGIEFLPLEQGVAKEL